MSVELRQVYVEKSLQQAYYNGDGIFINIHEDKLRQFLLSSLENYAFQKVNKPILLILKALCQRYQLEFDVQEEEEGEITFVVFKGKSQQMPKMKVVQVIEANIKQKLGDTYNNNNNKQTKPKQKKPVKVLVRNKNKQQCLQKQQQQKKVDLNIGNIEEKQINKQQVISKSQQVIQKQQIKQVIDTSAFQSSQDNAIIYNGQYDTDFDRKYGNYGYNAYTMNSSQNLEESSYNPYHKYPHQSKQKQIQIKEKFNFKDEDFPSL